jgi:hypothetical protein
MKHITFIAPLLLAAAVLAGCDSKSSEEKTGTQPVTAPVSTATTALPQNNAATTTQNSTATPAAPIINTIPQPVNTAAAAAGINPAHGQPGHNCDIAVGAPLNSKPVQQPTVVQQPVISTTTQPAPVVTKINTSQTNNAVTAATGLNPEHGKPGHRCDISVGAPLNSKPAQQPNMVQQPAATTAPQQPFISDAQKITPPVITSATTTVAEGMNPEHGKPGHRCDISVGAPLNSKPKQ